MVSLPLIVFDVNDTLLDLTTMEPTFERIFGFGPGRSCRSRLRWGRDRGNTE